MVWNNLFAGKEKRLLAIQTLRERYPTTKVLLDEYHRLLNAGQQSHVKISRAMARDLAAEIGLLPPVKRRKPVVSGPVVFGTPIDPPTQARNHSGKRYPIATLGS